ncbi:pyridoxal-phosphate dependent enzyme [Paracoccus onubensis]|uniref:Pyridoxal-phosphate dependent enzyme n=2 Tax=Paracoccus onubensis TaxID=1675788 RepID=A0A418T201_9RHOB|nr:pyridoxal-phosphate dependent enzyme [Paracoccus onubensis]
MNMGRGYICIRCGARYSDKLSIDSRGCPACYEDAPANLRVMQGKAPGKQASSISTGAELPSLWRYANRLPCPEDHAVSLGEGLTPLIRAPGIGNRLGLAYLYVKDEGRNPTWSHKDRFSTVAVSVAKGQGARIMATASSGNAGASLAAYAARAGLTCLVATFAGATGPMLAQIRKAGGIIVPFTNKADRWAFIAEGVDEQGWFATSPFRAPVVGSHPAGVEGYKTLAYEIVEQLGDEVPDWCVLPVCYGDALAGLWWGFQDLYAEGKISHLPRLVAAEVHGSLSKALAGGDDLVSDMRANGETLAVSIGATRSTFQALQALRQSEGRAVTIGNANLIAWQEELASREGIFTELTSVAPLAAIEVLRNENIIKHDDRVVVIATASGLKDVERSSPEETPHGSFASVAKAWEYLSGSGWQERRFAGPVNPACNQLSGV